MNPTPSFAFPLTALAAATVVAFAPAAWSSPAAKGPQLQSGQGCIVAEAPVCSPVERGASLPKGTFIAGAEGATLLLDDGSVVALEPGTRVRPGPPLQVPIEGKHKVLSQIVQVLEGKAYITVASAPRAPTAVQVRMPNKVRAVVKSGTTAVTVAPEAPPRIAALSGAALISGDEDHWALLAAGHGRTFAPGDPEGKAFALPAAPALAPSRTLTTSLICDASPTEVRWAPVEGAASYRILVRSLPGGQPVARFGSPAGKHAVTLQGLQPGRYTAEVQAVAADGTDGLLSRALKLSIVGVDLPKGARVTGGMVILGPGQEIKLAHAEGLEASFSLHEPFVPAPAVVSLRGHQLGMVRLRQPGSNEAELLLSSPNANRQVRARVQLGPARVTWPQSPVHATIDLVDHEGSPLKENVEVRTRVMLGREPLAVTWRREGSRLVAEIPPRPLSKPEALRVEVTDTSGTVVGRGLLELVPDRFERKEKRVASRLKRSPGGLSTPRAPCPPPPHRHATVVTPSPPRRPPTPPGATM